MRILVAIFTLVCASAFGQTQTNLYIGMKLFIGMPLALPRQVGVPPNPTYQWTATNGVLKTIGGAVTNWTDQISSLVLKTDVSSAPQWTASVQNTLPGISPGVSGWMTNKLTASLTTGTVIIACRTSVSIGSFEGLIDDLDGTHRWAIYKDNSNPDKFGALASAGILSQTIKPLTNYVVAVKFNGASSSIWTNGVSSGSGDTGSSTFQGITVGNLNGKTLGWTGYIFEIRIYNTVLSDADVATVSTEIKTTWALY